MRHASAPGERLGAVLDMLGTAETVWDVGCDHGRLACALLKNGAAKHVIATDISPASAAKALRLLNENGLGDRASVAVADGLSGFLPTGRYKLALCGMGGELIAQILKKGDIAASGAELIVMQPMRGEEELRAFLLENDYEFIDERAVFEDGRYYQLIAARRGKRSVVPSWFPKNYYRFGWLMCEKRDPVLMELLQKYRGVYEAQLQKAAAAGRRPQKLVDELDAVDTILRHITAEEL